MFGQNIRIRIILLVNVQGVIGINFGGKNVQGKDNKKIGSVTMKILLTGNSMNNFSGQPMSTYETARELAKEHDVTVVCGDGGWNGNELQQGLEEVGVKCQYHWGNKYDLVLASEWCPWVGGYKVQIVRGITEWEKPIAGVDFYSCIRPEVQEHIITKYRVDSRKTKVIWNGVDRTRFKPIVKTPRDHIKIVAPCTVDSLREKWLNHLAGRLNEEAHLYIYGEKTKYAPPDSPFIHYEKPTFHMENIIADADSVVGIYLGRVNLEARSCDVPSFIYDPYTLKHELFEISDEDFEERHNIKNVAKKLVALAC